MLYSKLVIIIIDVIKIVILRCSNGKWPPLISIVLFIVTFIFEWYRTNCYFIFEFYLVLFDGLDTIFILRHFWAKE